MLNMKCKCYHETYENLCYPYRAGITGGDARHRAGGGFWFRWRNSGETYTLEQMLTYAMQDEYMAQAEYAAIIAEYGDNTPFANIINAELAHIDLLAPLFATYGLTLPENTATAKVTAGEPAGGVYRRRCRGKCQHCHV